MTPYINRFGAPASPALAEEHLAVQVQAEQEARQLYRQAYWTGWLAQRWSQLTGAPWRLLDLTTVTATTARGTRHPAGVQAIPLEQIQGSDGRCHDFDRAFRPLQQHTEARWVRVAMAGLLGVVLPPIEVIHLGACYFVRDGHHRVSVARALGRREIEAVVSVWETSEACLHCPHA